MSEYGTTGSSAMAGLHHMSHSLPPTSAEHLLGHAQQVSAAHQMQQQVAFAHHHQPSPQQQLHASGRQTPQQYVQHPLAYGSTNPLAFDAAAQLTGVASATNLYGVSAAAAAAAAAAAGSYGLGGFAVNPYGAHTPVGFPHQQQAQQPIQQQQQQQQLHQQQQQQQQQQPQIKHENDELIGVNFASYGLSHTNTSQSMQR
ncbi:hypothetical protein GQ42DRAFT_162533 [Ramicandelaber brevisporus]|nr:hypothetical protein GQ42DRAFT_162533 [Ramicandelaber brevisporus]